MAEKQAPYCPECAGEPIHSPELDRRGFLRAVGATAAVAGMTGLLGTRRALGDTATKPAPRPAEELVKELFAGMTDDQKKTLVVRYDHGAENGKGRPTRL